MTRLNKRGSVRDIIVIAVVFFVIASSFFIFNFITKQAITEIVAIPQINETEEVVDAMESVSTQADRLDYVAFAFLIALLLAFAITGYFIGGNKIFMFIYFIVTVIGVIISVLLSNVWDTITNSSVFGLTITSFPLSNHIIGNFAIYVAIFGFIGIIAMFARPTEE